MHHPIPKVSVIIPTYKSWDKLKDCIEATTKQTYPNDLVEIIVINNLPNDDPPFDLRPAKLFSEIKKGSYAARNKGIAEASGEILAFTDSDCIPDPNWLSEAVKIIIEKNADRVAGQIEITFSKKKLSAVEAYQKALSFNQKRLSKHGLSVTANLVCTKRAIDKVGLFNSNLFSGGDWEWNRRANAVGLNLFYAAESIVRHPARPTWADLIKKSRRVNSNIQNTEFSVNTLAKVLVHFFSGFIPPIKRGIEIFLNKNLSQKEKIQAWMVCYSLKIYSHTVRLLSHLRLIEPTRE